MRATSVDRPSHPIPCLASRCLQYLTPRQRHLTRLRLPLRHPADPGPRQQLQAGPRRLSLVTFNGGLEPDVAQAGDVTPRPNLVDDAAVNHAIEIITSQLDRESTWPDFGSARE
jgi:hypothetical protein